MHPWDRLKRFSKNYLLTNQADKIYFPQILPLKKLIQKNKNNEYIKKVLLHPCERLRHKKKMKQEPETQYIKTLPKNTHDWLSRRLENKPANIACNEEFLKEFPDFNRKIKVNKTDKIKRREVIIYKISKQIPLDNNKYYAKYYRDSDTYYIGKEDEKKIIVIESSDDKKNKREGWEK